MDAKPVRRVVRGLGAAMPGQSVQRVVRGHGCCMLECRGRSWCWQLGRVESSERGDLDLAVS